jgi:glyoxylase-like metal-dependent hydrolase (beta-lactamase superfamily II)
MTHEKWEIGEVTIHQIVELKAGSLIQSIIEEARPEVVRDIEWVCPDFADDGGHLKALVQSFIIEDGDDVILVDSSNGNDKTRSNIPEWSNLQTDFMLRLQETGVKPENVDFVLCTHLHMDHVGWNTKLIDGRWNPTFPNADYLFVRPEFDYWKDKPEKEIADDKAAFEDSVRPIDDVGLSKLVPADHNVTDSVRLIPTPGHTPGHVSVEIESEGEKALISGDLLYHPCQIAEPEWTAQSDSDPQLATKTRKQMLEKLAKNGALLIGSHFPQPVAGKVVKTEDGFKLKT